ncbi:MAG: hypothetical protein R6W67_08190, partial [Bacteroidales bacterium]
MTQNEEKKIREENEENKSEAAAEEQVVEASAEESVEAEAEKPETETETEAAAAVEESEEIKETKAIEESEPEAIEEPVAEVAGESDLPTEAVEEPVAEPVLPRGNAVAVGRGHAAPRIGDTMHVTFGAHADGNTWPEHGGDGPASFGTPVVGPAGLVSLLEVELGLGGRAKRPGWVRGEGDDAVT